jgi:nitroreductase
MDALEVLLQRVSVSKLTAPAPAPRERELIFKAALRAADHGRLRPWRFLVVEEGGLTQLGDLYVEAAMRDDPTIAPDTLDRYRQMPLRAPMLVVVIAQCRAHPKVPEIEQIISAGAAAQNMINAAYALDIGAIWRTGEFAYHPHVKKGLGLAENEKIVGYLYLGTPVGSPGSAPELDYRNFFNSWPPR